MKKHFKTSQLLKIYLGVAVCLVAIVPLLLSSYQYSALETFLATLLLEICLYPTVRRFARKETGLPTMPVFCGAYALQFALPIFTREATIDLAYGEVRSLNNSDVVASLIMAIVGITAVQAGFYLIQRSEARKAVPIVQLPLQKNKAVLFCIIIGFLVPLLFTFQGVIPEEFQQPLSSILRLLQNQMLVVIGILAWLVYGKKSGRLYSLWLHGLVFLAAMRGISTGFLEEALVPIAVLFIVKWLYTTKVPVGPIILTVLLVIFLSPAKSQYRQELGMEEQSASSYQTSGPRAFVWIEQASDYWKDTFLGNRDLTEATASATSRTDLVHQVAHIYSLTPAVIPYQYGGTYTYFIVALIPRVIWADKPVAGNANNFFAVTYGISTEEAIKGSTFGVSLLGESFINFGWFGVVLVMLLQGVILGLLQYSFGEARSGPGGQAVFLAFFVFFLNGIGSSAEILFGNILQNLLCGYFLLLWAREKAPVAGKILRPRAIQFNT